MHSLSLSLARHPRLVACARAVRLARGHRLARIALCREIVRCLLETMGQPQSRTLRDGDVAIALLCALLRATGERAAVEYTREMALVRVRVSRADIGLLPAWARLLRDASGEVALAIAPDVRWIATAYLPPDVRMAFAQRSSGVNPDLLPIRERIFGPSSSPSANAQT